MKIEETPNRPTLVALVYRLKTGCRQYCFYSIEELQKWASRSPYKKEMVRVMPFSENGRQLADRWKPAAEVGAWTKEIIAEHDERSFPIGKH